jgi:hypothetical protein
MSEPTSLLASKNKQKQNETYLYIFVALLQWTVVLISIFARCSIRATDIARMIPEL